jgi:predicted Zn finger-like uncharacterized protein
MGITRIVECERCGSGLEIDRILIGPNGTPVRCGTCDAVFTVLPEDENKLSSPVVWLLKDARERTTPFSRIEVLQRVIMEGTARRDWQLSRFGESWRRLGDIEGLKIFFERADG